MSARAISNTCGCGHYRVQHVDGGACRECECEGYREATLPVIVHQHARPHAPPKPSRGNARAVLDAIDRTPAPVAHSGHIPPANDAAVDPLERDVRGAVRLALDRPNALDAVIHLTKKQSDPCCACAEHERIAIRAVDANMSDVDAIALTVLERLR